MKFQKILFSNDKRNWMLIGGIVGEILIGWFGQSTTEVVEPINEKLQLFYL